MAGWSWLLACSLLGITLVSPNGAATMIPEQAEQASATDVEALPDPESAAATDETALSTPAPAPSDVPSPEPTAAEAEGVVPDIPVPAGLGVDAVDATGPIIDLIEGLLGQDDIEGDYYRRDGAFENVPRLGNHTPVVRDGPLSGGGPAYSSGPWASAPESRPSGGPETTPAIEAAPAREDAPPEPPAPEGPVDVASESIVSDRAPPRVPPAAWPWIGVAAVGVALTIRIWQPHPSVAFRIGAAALYSRISADGLLGNPRRQKIVDFVESNPGCRITQLRQAVEVPNGAFFHHVFLLECRGRLRLQRVGNTTYVYPPGARLDSAPAFAGSRRTVWETIRNAPGASHQDVVKSTGLSRRIVGYHIAELAQAQRVRVERRGRFKHCWPLEGGDASSPAPVSN